MQTNLNVEMIVLASLRAREDRAITESDLKAVSGITGLSFKEAVIRLVRKKLAVKWKSERLVNYLVASEFAYSAYYEEPVVLPDLYLAMGHPASTVMVRRSMPFVVLEDPDLKKSKHNRYRSAMA